MKQLLDSSILMMIVLAILVSCSKSSTNAPTATEASRNVSAQSLSGGTPAPFPYSDIPIRGCVVEGSPILRNENPHLALFSQLFGVTGFVYNPDPEHETLVGFHAAGEFAVINDPCPPSMGCPGEVGDIVLSGDLLAFAEEAAAAVMECKDKWGLTSPGARGIVLVNVRRFVGKSGAPTEDLGIAPLPTALPAEREKLCRYPRLVSVDHVGAWAMIIDPAFDPTSLETLGHELGHVLLLGHGDGIDNDGDSLQPPDFGARLFDDFCDPGERSTGTSLMSAMSRNRLITPLQKEAIKNAAQVAPGVRFLAGLGRRARLSVADSAQQVFTLSDEQLDRRGDVLDRSIDILSVGITVDRIQQKTSFSYTLAGGIQEGTNRAYDVFLDVDKDALTGGAPSRLAFPTRFQGADLVIHIEASDEKARGVSARLWRYHDKERAFIDVTSPKIGVKAFNQMDAELKRPLFGMVSLEIPNDIIGQIGTEMRLQAIARQLDEKRNELDRLPDKPDDGSVKFLWLGS